jgi:hypothetical protein
LAASSLIVVADIAACGGSGSSNIDNGSGGAQGADAAAGFGGNAGSLILNNDASASGGTAGSMSQSGLDGASSMDSGSTCPPYQTFCGSMCIPTSEDPNNCGGCGVKCMGNDVCSSSGCASSCLPGLTACDHRCVDLENDNAHCGDCMTACAVGKGCVNKKCIDAVPVGNPPAKCAGGGPPISVSGATVGCTGGLAQITFRWALCSCTDLDVSAPLTTDAYDSTMGAYKPGGLGAGVGVDRDVTHWSQAVSIGGDLWVAGTDSYQSSGPASEVKVDMELGGSWKASSPFTVDRNAFVTGTLMGVTVKGKTTPTPMVPPPCDCAPQDIIPVAAIVAAHKSPNNDDASIGLMPTVFESPAAPLRLDLPCGNYYFTSIATSQALTIAAHGHTAIYIDGDVVPSAPLALILDPTATLDIFISGTIKASQTIVIGSPNYPALSRTYVGGTAKLSFSQDVRIGGEFYAANSALVDWSAHEDIYGAVFAGNFKSSQVTNIHYDRGVLEAGKECPPPSGSQPDAGGGAGGSNGAGGGEGAGGAGGAGGGSTGCMSCNDCGNQACINGACGACRNDGDCCSPLECRGGMCLPTQIN